MSLYIFSDGNCKSNGTPNARAAYSIYFADKELYHFNKTDKIDNPSNNRAELSGILEILKTIHNNSLFQNKKIIICTDSMYSINCVTVWSDNWIKNNWQNSKKQPVKNQDIIKEILTLKGSIGSIEFKFISAHKPEPIDKNSIEYFFWYGNNKVDSDINDLLKLKKK